MLLTLSETCAASPCPSWRTWPLVTEGGDRSFGGPEANDAQTRAEQDKSVPLVSAGLPCPFFDEVHLTQKVTHVCRAFVAPVVSAR